VVFGLIGGIIGLVFGLITLIIPLALLAWGASMLMSDDQKKKWHKVKRDRLESKAWRDADDIEFVEDEKVKNDFL
jgi:hypothetical protein